MNSLSTQQIKIFNSDMLKNQFQGSNNMNMTQQKNPKVDPNQFHSSPNRGPNQKFYQPQVSSH